MSGQHDPFRMLVEGLKRYGIEMDRQGAALRLAENEFKLKASFKGLTFSTTLNRSRRLVHMGEQCFSVWRWDEDGVAQLVRVVARGLCGQWIVSAERADWRAAEDSRCEACLEVARELVADQAQDELASAAEEVSA